MEEPYTGVIGLEAKHKVAISWDYSTVALLRYGGQRALIAVPGPGSSSNDLEDMAMEMHRMRPHLRVLEVDLYNLPRFDNPRICPWAVCSRVHGCFAGRQSSQQGWDLRRYPGLRSKADPTTDAIDIGLIHRKIDVIVYWREKPLPI